VHALVSQLGRDAKAAREVLAGMPKP
jgi:hypothetical protein